MPTKPELVTLPELAERLGMDRSHARRFILNAGYTFLRTRTKASRNQLTLALSKEDADTVYRLRAERGFGTERTVKSLDGHFYAIAIAPDMDRKRVKFGFAQDIDERLSTYRTLSPTAEVIAKWPCKRSWETAARDCIAAGCKRIGTEVYVCENIKAMKKRGAAFFAMAPKVKS